MKAFLLMLVKTYQRYISVLFLPCCRFHPTCSEYMVEALTEYGVIKGLFLGTQRLCRCHPLHEGGMDPVPHKIKKACN